MNNIFWEVLLFFQSYLVLFLVNQMSQNNIWFDEQKATFLMST